MRKEIRDPLVKELFSKYEKIMKELGYRLSNFVLLGRFGEVLVKKYSKSKSVFEYLVEKRAIKEINKGRTRRKSNQKNKGICECNSRG